MLRLLVKIMVISSNRVIYLRETISLLREKLKNDKMEKIADLNDRQRKYAKENT